MEVLESSLNRELERSFKKNFYLLIPIYSESLPEQVSVCPFIRLPSHVLRNLIDIKPIPSMVYSERERFFFDDDFQCPIFNFGDSPLHIAAKSGDIAKLEKLLKQPATDVNAANGESGATPLMAACSMGRYAAVKRLIQAGADVNHKAQGLDMIGVRYSDTTALHIATCGDRPELIDLLVKHGADVNCKTSPRSYTPLHLSVKYEKWNAFAALIQAPGIDPNIPRYDGATPLHRAVAYNLMVEKLLMVKGIDVNAVLPPENATPLHCAVYYRNLLVVEQLLVWGANPNARLFSGHSPLDIAMQMGDKRIADLVKRAGGKRGDPHLGQIWVPWGCAVVFHGVGTAPVKRKIVEGCDCVNVPLSCGSTALHHGVLQDETSGCEFLLNYGANVNARTFQGYEPIHLAAATGNLEIVKLLLRNGAQVGARTTIDCTPLHFAIENGCYSVAKYLLSQGADIKARNKYGDDMLYSAIGGLQPHMVTFVLQNGIDVHNKYRVFTVESDQVSALHIACTLAGAGDSSPVVKVLIEAGADVNERIDMGQGLVSPLQVAVLSWPNCLKLCRILVENGAYVDACVKLQSSRPRRTVDMDAMTYYQKSLDREAKEFLLNTLLLLRTVRKNDLGRVQQFCEKGAAVNCRSEKFDTPLVYAAWKGFLPILVYLLSKGADPNMSSPLHYAAKFGQKEAVVQLLKYGADSKKRIAGKTALQLAEERGHADIVKLLKFVDLWLEESGEQRVKSLPDFKHDDNVVKIVDQLKGDVAEDDLCALFEKL
ncbi:unnamed protein product [Nesidiocoris tenuis]|uniref:Uncharacterized protein n=1 Tax=Nesidiocoris tenuis TaxID=355587 RepID=A0A6H5GEX3_9HEMI|nr:unnamed protein product [Nesidiocoris tenuis]